MKKLRTLLIVLAALGGGVYLTLFLAGKGLEWFVWEDYKRFRSIAVGMSEIEVRRSLGEPQRVYEAADAPEDYNVKGYAYEKRAITGRVLIYVGDEPIAYVYIDPGGHVEHVFVGGS